MDFFERLIDIVLHLDRHLGELTAQYGTWTYAILMLIVFCETGLVITPILPGDSLLFAAGTIASLGTLDPALLNVLLFAAVLMGDNVNYWIGRYVGPKAYAMNSRFFKKKHLEYTQGFFARHGGMTVVLARFVPIVRTFTPFVAGIGAMTYPRFLGFSVLGAVIWVTTFIWVGYFFGNLPIVRQNFSLVVLAILILSVLPLVITVLKERRRARVKPASDPGMTP